MNQPPVLAEEEEAVLKAAVEVVVVAVVAAEEEALLQPLALLHMVMADQTGASRAIPPLSLMEIDPKASNS